MNKKLQYFIFFASLFLLSIKYNFAQQLPASPYNLTGSIVSQTQDITQIKLSWTYGDVSNIYKFIIYSKKSRETQYNQIGEAPYFSFEYIDQVPSENDTYYYYVTALDQNGQESAPSNVISINVIKPQSLSPSPPSSGGGDANYYQSQSDSAIMYPESSTTTTSTIPTTTVPTTTFTNISITTQTTTTNLEVKNFYYRLNTKDLNLSHIQKFLKEKGYLFNYKKGVFDRYTVEAIKRYQISKKLYPSGVIGPITLKEIKKDFQEANINLKYPIIEFKRTLKINSKGKDVIYLSITLKELGYYKYYPTAIFNKNLEIALKAFQKKNNLMPTGRLDKNTINLINNILNK